ncbi:MAG TPA: hypothetical protein VF043_20660 [Ktedonobacteraceae bacterium]
MLLHTFPFDQPISVEMAPEGHLCEWCSTLAVYRLTAIGGIHHNQAGFFCQGCGEDFALAVCKSMGRIHSTPGHSMQRVINSIGSERSEVW